MLSKQNKHLTRKVSANVIIYSEKQNVTCQNYSLKKRKIQ